MGGAAWVFSTGYANRFECDNCKSSNIGGAVTLYGAIGFVLTNTILKNSQAGSGAGIWMVGTTGAVVRDVKIDNCVSTGKGGGMFVGSSTPVLVRAPPALSPRHMILHNLA